MLRSATSKVEPEFPGSDEEMPDAGLPSGRQAYTIAPTDVGATSVLVEARPGTEPFWDACSQPPSPTFCSPRVQSDDASRTEEESDGTTSAKERASSKERAVVARSKRRLKLMATSAAEPTLGGLSLLERTPAKPATETSYKDAVKSFLAYTDVINAKRVEDEDVHAATVDFICARFGEGVPPTTEK